MKHADYLKTVTRAIWRLSYAKKIQEELLAHLIYSEEELAGDGWTAEDAENEAQRRLGDPRMLSRVWTRSYYSGLLGRESLAGLVVGVLVASEPVWMGALGYFSADALIVLVIGLVGVAFYGIFRHWRAKAWTAGRTSGQAFLGMFWVTLITVSLLVALLHPSVPRGFADWYGWGYIHHALWFAGGLTGITGAVWLFGDRWHFWSEAAR